MKKIILALTIYIFSSNSIAAEKVIDLIVDYKTVNFANKMRTAIAVNNQIPAPTLHFKQGDHVKINVRNNLNEDTAIHWHGIILPWQMDGVEGVTQKGIMPGKTFTYEFTLEQSGTYWYHAHAGLQEQEGLYGALVVSPLKDNQLQYSNDFVIVLSDWSNTSAEQIYSNLKKQGDYYSPYFALQPSLSKFIHDYCNASCKQKQIILDDYKMMQQMRMSIYDYSDIAYDAFLLNGQTKCKPWTGLVKVGDVVRLRFIGASASTIFKVKIPDTKMQMVQAQGNDVRPYLIKDFTIAPGETYDILVKIEKNRPYIIYAESADTIGAAYGALITTPNQKVNYNIAPFPNPLPVSQEMMTMDHSSSTHKTNPMPRDMNHDMNHDMHKPLETFFTTNSTKYQSLIAAVKTNDPSIPVTAEIKMELFGYMNRYIWFINGKTEHEVMPYIFEPGKRYRFVFTNNSMMHHPMHIHGHWFILRNGNNEYDPLLHTIDVAPGATITADVDTDASGQWFFHCHMLYHMYSGMGRVFQYSTLLEVTQNKMQPENIIKPSEFVNRPIVRVDEIRPIDKALIKHPMAHQTSLFLANFLDVGFDPSNNRQKFNFKGLYGYDYNKLELFINDAEINQGKVENADLDIFYWHLLAEFWAIKAGVNYFYRPADVPYWQPGIGVEGITPYFIDVDFRVYYHSGSVKFDLELLRDCQITNNFILRAAVRGVGATKTVSRDQIGSGLNQMRYIIHPYYRITPRLNIFAEYEYERNYGVFKKLQTIAGEPKVQNTVTLGVGIIF